MSALSSSVVEQLLWGAGHQFAEFKSERGFGPLLFDQTVKVRRERFPEAPALWRVEVSASFIDTTATSFGRVKRGEWSTWHTDLAEALIAAGRNAERFRWSLYKRGNVG